MVERTQCSSNNDHTSVDIKDSVVTKLIKSVFSFYLLIALSVTLLDMYIQYDTTQKDVVDDLALFYEMFEPGVANALYNLDYTVMQDIIVGIVKVKNITGVLITDELGEQIGASGDVSMDNSMSNSFWRTFQVELNADELGSVTLFSNHGIVFDKVKTGFFLTVVSAMIKTIALFIIFSCFGRVLLSRPLALMTQSAKKVEMENLQDLHVQTNTKGNNELKVLETAFNDMIQKLLHARLQLEDNAQQMALHQHSLASLVQARTSELEQSNVELKRTLNHLQTTQNQLIESEKMASLGNLVAGIAHEINTPVGVSLTGVTHIQTETHEIIQHMENNALRESELTSYLDKVTTMTQSMRLSLEKAGNLVRSFKQVAIDQHDEVKRTFNLYDYTNKVILSLHSVLRNIEVCNHVDQGLMMYSYPGVISQILTHLITNALAHAYEKEAVGIITIQGAKRTDRLMICFDDDGKGMSSDVLAKIFDPFFTTCRGRGGSGLGLHIVYNLVVQKLHGQVSCHSTEGKGAAFVIDIPIGERSVAESTPTRIDHFD